MDDQTIERKLKSIPRLTMTEEFRARFSEALQTHRDVGRALKTIPHLSPSRQAPSFVREKPTLFRRRFMRWIAAAAVVLITLAVIILVRPGTPTTPRQIPAASAPTPPSYAETAARFAQALITERAHARKEMLAFIDGQTGEFTSTKHLSFYWDTLKTTLERLLLDYSQSHRFSQPLYEKITRAGSLLSRLDDPMAAALLHEVSTRSPEFREPFSSYLAAMSGPAVQYVLRQGLTQEETRELYFSACLTRHRELMAQMVRDLSRTSRHSQDMLPYLIRLKDVKTIDTILVRAGQYQKETGENTELMTHARLAIRTCPDIATERMVIRLIGLLASPVLERDARHALKTISGRDGDYTMQEWRKIFFKEKVS